MFRVRSREMLSCSCTMHNTKEWMREEAAKPDFFSADRMSQLMRIFMLDQHGCNDKKMQRMCKSSVLMARPWVLYQWFMVLSKIHRRHGVAVV